MSTQVIDFSRSEVKAFKNKNSSVTIPGLSVNEERALAVYGQNYLSQIAGYYSNELGITLTEFELMDKLSRERTLADLINNNAEIKARMEANTRPYEPIQTDIHEIKEHLSEKPEVKPVKKQTKSE